MARGIARDTNPRDLDELALEARAGLGQAGPPISSGLPPQRRVLPFAQPAPVLFPAPLEERTVYLFPFSDQVFFPKTLGSRTALARLSLDPPWLAPVLTVLVRLRVTALLARRRASGGPAQRLTAWLQKRYAGRDWYGLVVEVQGPNGSVRASLVGRGQADITALGAAAIARAIIDEQVSQPGIWLAEQVVPPGPFLQYLAANSVVPRVEAAGVGYALPSRAG